MQGWIVWCDVKRNHIIIIIIIEFADTRIVKISRAVENR